MKARCSSCFKQDHLVTLAQHRSHRSHSSHRSHRSHSSHRSSAGGYSAPSYEPPVSVPAPVYAPPAPVYRPPSSSSGSPARSSLLDPVTDGAESAGSSSAPQALSGRSAQFQAILRRVQIGLLAQEFYEGAIDGSVGPVLRGALREFQTSVGLSVTGTITPETLDALKISSE